jgi:hypothetical protein
MNSEGTTRRLAPNRYWQEPSRPRRSCSWVKNVWADNVFGLGECAAKAGWFVMMVGSKVPIKTGFYDEIAVVATPQPCTQLVVEFEPR